MIKHIVLLQFKPEISNDEIGSILQQLGNLRSEVPSMKHFSFGENCSPEHLNKGFNHAFVMDFEDIKGRDVYLNHPEHIRIAQEVIVPILKNGLESAITIDYEY